MKKLPEFIKGLTKTQKILLGVGAVAVVALATVATLYGVKRFKAKNVA